MKIQVSLDEYLENLWNFDKSIKRLSNPSYKFQYVHFVLTDKGTFTYFTNNVQFIQNEIKSFICEKKWPVGQVADYIAKHSITKKD